MNDAPLRSFIANAWDHAAPEGIVAALKEYITIPNDSPGFDPDWAANGHMDRAVDLFVKSLHTLMRDWSAKGCRTDDIAVHVHSAAASPETGPDGKRRSPLLHVEVPAQGGADGTILLYGHLDKQPGLEGLWAPGLGPRLPVIRDGRLYGRGGADDGYALFSAFAAVMALRAAGRPHARCVILVEACEESGSLDLEHYIRTLQASLGDVRLVVCLDSGCGNYDQLWLTNSLRGVVGGILNIGVLREGVHSGDASGVAPSPFRILRQLLQRLENTDSGEITPDFLKVDIPDSARAAAGEIAALRGDAVFTQYPFLDGVRPVDADPAEALLNRAWRSQLVVKGMDGFPPAAGSGNVLLPNLAASLSLRLPPTLDSARAAAGLKDLLEKDPPYNARIRFDPEASGNGWAAPEAPQWFADGLQAASQNYFGKPALATGEGGSIPFMNLLATLFPRALFFVTGVLGPGSNAHGPDEFLDLPTAEKLTLCVAHIIARQAEQE